MRNLRLLKQTNTADDYVTSFEILEKDIDYNETSLINAYKSRVKDALIDFIYKFKNVPVILAKWKESQSKWINNEDPDNRTKHIVFLPLDKREKRPSLLPIHPNSHQYKIKTQMLWM
jgi:hypothetical protein